MNYLPASRKN